MFICKNHIKYKNHYLQVKSNSSLASSLMDSDWIPKLPWLYRLEENKKRREEERLNWIQLSLVKLNWIGDNNNEQRLQRIKIYNQINHRHGQ